MRCRRCVDGISYKLQASSYDKDRVQLFWKLPGYCYSKTEKTGYFTVRTAGELIKAASVLLAVDCPIPRDMLVHASTLERETRKRIEKISTRSRRLAKIFAPLHPYQVAGASWLALRPAALLADEMGLGKTIQALVSRIPKSSPTLIICPAFLRSTWQQEVAKWRAGYCVVVKKVNEARYPDHGEIVIMSYKATAGLTEGKQLDPAKGTVVILDEAHYIKNYETQRHICTKSIANAVLAAGGRVHALTGTPITNRPLDLFSILSVLHVAWAAFGSWDKFAWAFGRSEDIYTGEVSWNGPKSEKQKAFIADALAPYVLRRTKKQVLPELPEKQRQTITVDVEKAHAIEIDDEIRRLNLATVTKNEIRELMENNVAFEKMSRLRKLLATAKIPTMIGIVKEYEEAQLPLVVFSAHRRPIEALSNRDGWVTVFGGMSDEQRKENVAMFQNGHKKGIGLTIKAGGHGLTLTRASHALFVDQSWSPAENIQAEDRIHRIGSNGANYQFLVADCLLDRHVTDILLSKRSTIASAEDLMQDDVDAAVSRLLLEAKEAKETVTAFRKTQYKRFVKLTDEGVGQLCPRCKKAWLEWRRSGPNSKRPGQEYIVCDGCKYFEWRADV